MISLAAGMEGYLFRPTGAVARGALLAGALLLMFPGWPTDLAGISLFISVVAKQVWA